MTPITTTSLKQTRYRISSIQLAAFALICLSALFTLCGMIFLHFIPPTSSKGLLYRVKDHDDVRQTQQQYDKYSRGPLQTLECGAYLNNGAVSKERAQEMVYWENNPGDLLFRSPFQTTHTQQQQQQQQPPQYLTFEYDLSGWNNVRLAFETVLALAVAMGRTLVLPPSPVGGPYEKVWVDLPKVLLDPEAIREKYKNIDIITLQEYLELEDSLPQLHELLVGNLNKLTEEDLSSLVYPALRDASPLLEWDPLKCHAGFSKHQERYAHLKEAKEKLEDIVRPWQHLVGKPPALNGTIIERLEHMHGGRSAICLYDAALQNIPRLHLPSREAANRPMLPFYGMVFFEDWRQDLWIKRFFRDNVRYSDPLQCYAAKVVQEVRKRARAFDPIGNPLGVFDSLHIRRGNDFRGMFRQGIAKVDTTAEEIYTESRRILKENTTVYIATDETNLTFFEPLRKHYHLIFLNDCLDLLNANIPVGRVDQMHYGLIDQLVASRGRYFLGAWFSTFTAYINRIRGYHSNRYRVEGFEQGAIPSWTYMLPDQYDYMREYYPLKRIFWAREFPAAWRLIDTGMEEYHKELFEDEHSIRSAFR